jgi:pre-mRNA-splicing factor ATP-dependent RNA helicase DHX38/PRP16
LFYLTDGELAWNSEEDKHIWEAEQKRLDREWYQMDEGYDEAQNPFAGVSENYTKKREEQLEQKKNKRMSAQQRQINKVSNSSIKKKNYPVILNRFK